jgi:hypothetical protein
MGRAASGASGLFSARVFRIADTSSRGERPQRSKHDSSSAYFVRPPQAASTVKMIDNRDTHPQTQFITQ